MQEFFCDLNNIHIPIQSILIKTVETRAAMHRAEVLFDFKIYAFIFA